MLNSGVVHKLGSAVIALVVVLLANTVAYAQAAPIVPGTTAGPVPERQGLLGTYYSYPVNSPTNLPSAGGSGPGSTPTSPMNTPPKQAGTVLLGEVLDGPFSPINWQANPASMQGLNGGSTDWFMVEYTGRLVITTADTYTFYTSSDDGERTWIGNVTSTTPTLDFWNQRGVVTDTSAGIALPLGDTDMRMEFEQGNGGASLKFEYSAPSLSRRVVPVTALRPPLGPAAPTLAASSPIAPPPPQVTLTWNTTAGATGYIITRNGVVLALINSGATTTYQDTAVAFGTAYSYQIQATSHSTICIGPASNTVTVTPTLPAVTVFPNTGLQTNENGASTVATVTFNQALPAGQTVTFTFTSNRPTEGIVSSSGQGPAATITFTVNGPQAIGNNFPLTIIGVDDPIVDGPQAYLIQCSTSGFFGAVTIPDLNCTNNDNDTPGITFSRTSGLVTTESGGTAVFTVVLNTQPTSNVTMNLTSSNTLEGTVSPASLTFTTVGGAVYSSATGIGGWNVSHDVTVTGVDDTLLDFTVPYTIVTGALSSTDPNYNNMAAPDVACVNLDNEVPPTLPTVWGNGGCGLMGVEFALPLLLAAMLRRRRNR